MYSHFSRCFFGSSDVWTFEVSLATQFHCFDWVSVKLSRLKVQFGVGFLWPSHHGCSMARSPDTDFMTASWPGARAGSWRGERQKRRERIGTRKRKRRVKKKNVRVELRAVSSRAELRRPYPCFDLCRRRPAYGPYRRTAWLGDSEIPKSQSWSCEIFLPQGFTIAFASGHPLSFTSTTERSQAARSPLHFQALDLEHFDRCDSDPLLEAPIEMLRSWCWQIFIHFLMQVKRWWSCAETDR